jgi:hypothetical protein
MTVNFHQSYSDILILNWYSLPSIIRMRWAGHAACMGEKRNVYRILAGKPEGKRAVGRPRCM